MRAEKTLLLNEIKEKIEGAGGFVVTRFQGLTSDKTRTFRTKMAEVNGEFEVVKKRVFIKAAEACGISIDLASLSGHIGILFAHGDAMQLVKGAYTYGVENDMAIELLTGKIDDAMCSNEELVALAKLPPLKEMQAQFIGLLAAPMTQVVGVLQGLLSSPLYCIEEKCQKEQA